MIERMLKARILVPLILLSVAIGVLHTTAITYFLYWKFWWFDMLVHFLAGMWVGILVIMIAYIFGLFSRDVRPTGKRLFVVTLFSALMIGLVWEFFELNVGLTFLTMKGYVPDTLTDVWFDCLGALCSAFYFYYIGA
ncbi:hypothetical protein KW783_02230 [Candidatus Parcubacteria bacterium]|nr:hypothetical protein [Candidatus Parcubacteria bacterium]